MESSTGSAVFNEIRSDNVLILKRLFLPTVGPKKCLLDAIAVRGDSNPAESARYQPQSSRLIRCIAGFQPLEARTPID